MKKESMTATAFKRWLKEMDFNHSEAAEALGSSRTSIIKWSREGAPKSILLATAWLKYTRASAELAK